MRAIDRRLASLSTEDRARWRAFLDGYHIDALAIAQIEVACMKGRAHERREAREAAAKWPGSAPIHLRTADFWTGMMRRQIAEVRRFMRLVKPARIAEDGAIIPAEYREPRA